MKLISNLSAIDRQATEDLGIPSLLLMEAAGRRVAEVVLETFKTYEIDALSANVVIFCGPGNNGGDGFVCARYLQQALDSQRFYGDITVVHLSAAEQYQGDAKTNLQLLQHYGFDDDGYFSLVSAQSDDSSEASLALASADLVVDAIFGSGLSRPPKDHYKYWIDEINDSEVPVVSIDLPSGINNQTGQVLDKAIKADETVTFMVSKPGLYLSPGRSYTGSVTVVDIGIPKPLIKNDPSPYRLTTEGFVKKMLPQHHEDSHKYDVGSLLVLAGSGTMPGAAE